MTPAEQKKVDSDFKTNLKTVKDAWARGDRQSAESFAYNLCCIARDPEDWIAQHPVPK